MLLPFYGALFGPLANYAVASRRKWQAWGRMQSHARSWCKAGAGSQG
jgi:hypothetical protein